MDRCSIQNKNKASGSKSAPMSKPLDKIEAKVQSDDCANNKRHHNKTERVSGDLSQLKIPLLPIYEIPGPSKQLKMEISPENKYPLKKQVPKSSKFFNSKNNIAATKHGILSRYLDAWLGALSSDKARYFGGISQYCRLVYVDGFAGPGRYKENNDSGSPLIAYIRALQHKYLPLNGPEIYMIFIEKDKVQANELLETLKQAKSENSMAKNAGKTKFMVINAEFATAMHWILSDEFIFTPDNITRDVPMDTSQDLNKKDRFVTENTPFFVFVDPFGYKGERIPMTLMQKIVHSTKKAEILLNLMTGFLQRFLEKEDQERAINLLIGQDESDSSWKTVVINDENGNRIKEMKTFVDHYYDKISEKSRKKTFVALFEMRNIKNSLLYNLFYICQNELAFYKMKDAMRTYSQSDLNFKYSSFKAKDAKLTRDALVVENLVQDLVHHFNDGEFHGRVIKGFEITRFINKDPCRVQRYRNKLSKELDTFRINKKKGVRQNFDEKEFKFFLSENTDTHEED